MRALARRRTGCGVWGTGHALFEEGLADVAEGDALRVLDDGAPWAELGDDDELFYAGHRRGLLLGREGRIAVARFMVVPAGLAWKEMRMECMVKKGVFAVGLVETHRWPG